ncbi:MAG TPA: aquaporin [Candidatus Nanoarchaeia archaeon]
MNREATPYLAELLGTFGFVLVGAGSVVVNSQTNGSLGVLGISLAHGLSLLAFIYAFNHISGAHFNPAVTISLWLVKKIEGSVAAGYVIAQLAGAVLAGIFIEGLFGSSRLAVPQPSLEPSAALLVEAILTFLLVLVVFGIIVDRRSHTSHAGLAIGLVFAGLVLVGFYLTGGALNPARAFGPALIANFWGNHLIYWFGPILGAAAAALVYEHGVLRFNK